MIYSSLTRFFTSKLPLGLDSKPIRHSKAAGLRCNTRAEVDAFAAGDNAVGTALLSEPKLTGASPPGTPLPESLPDVLSVLTAA